jgi:hypothetical protein
MRRMVGVLRGPDAVAGPLLAIAVQRHDGAVDVVSQSVGLAALLDHVHEAGLPVELRTEGDPADSCVRLNLRAVR